MDFAYISLFGGWAGDLTNNLAVVTEERVVNRLRWQPCFPDACFRVSGRLACTWACTCLISPGGKPHLSLCVFVTLSLFLFCSCQNQPVSLSLSCTNGYFEIPVVSIRLGTQSFCSAQGIWLCLLFKSRFAPLLFLPPECKFVVHWHTAWELVCVWLVCVLQALVQIKHLFFSCK